MEALQRFEIPEYLLMIVAGAMVLLFGYRIKKIAFFIIWFLLGFSGISYLMPMINEHLPEVAASDLFQCLIPIGGGLLLAMLGFSIEKFCVGGIAFALTMLITVQYFGTDTMTLIVGGVMGVAASVLAVSMMKPATIAATTIAGAYALTVGLLTLCPDISREVFYWPMLVGFSAIGLVFQFSTTKHVH